MSKLDVSHLTTLEELHENVRLLAAVDESHAPFVNCYLNLEAGPVGWRAALDERARILRRVLKGNDLADFEESLCRIEAWLVDELIPEARGAAIFTRSIYGGACFVPMQFAAPLPNWIAVYPTPNLYHLVELKDNYHRYVVLLAMRERACILEVNLGAATTLAWLDRSGLRVRVGSGWSRMHYQVNQADREERFVTEKLAVLEQLMHAGGHTHLILAGDPEISERVRRALPEALVNKLVRVIPAGERDRQSDVVMATLSSFLEHEEQESKSVAERLIAGVRTQTLAVAGSADTLEALLRGDVDTLVMASTYEPDPGWFCTACRSMGTEAPESPVCPRCGKSGVRPSDVREALLRQAGQLERPVEVVERSDALTALGGVGCLLRTNFDSRTARSASSSALLRR